MPSLQMTRAEYQTKYGVAPIIPVATTTQSSAPIQMTHSEYMAKYGSQPTNPEQPSTLSNIVGGAKAAVGGIASGIGGIALTGIDWAGRKAIQALPDTFSVNGVTKKQMLENLAKAPSLQEQFKQQMGGTEHPNIYGAGQLGGEIATLAAPVGLIGTGGKVLAETLGAGKKVATLAKAGTEGLAFTAGQSATEGNRQSLSDYATNAGLNMVFPIGGMALKGVAESAPARIINSLIKPLAKDFSYGKNPGQAVAELGITGNTFEDLINGIRSKRNEVGSTIGSVISQARVPGRIDLVQTLSPIDEALVNARKTPRTNATLIQRLESVKQDLIDNAGKGGIQDAQDLKGIVGDLTKWTGNATDDATVNKSLKQVYGGIVSKMDESLQKVLTPEQFSAYKKATEQYGNLLSAENAAVYRDKIVSRQDLISFGAKNAGLLTGLTTAVATGGAAIPAILAGLTGTVIDKVAATPAFKTRLAALLTKLPKEDVGTFFDKVPGAKSLFTEEQLKNMIPVKFSDAVQRILNMKK